MIPSLVQWGGDMHATIDRKRPPAVAIIGV